MLKLKLINSPKPLKIKFSYNFPEVLPVVLEEKTIIPKIVDQIIIPSSNYDGMSQVTVKAVDSTIDKNIKSENIKKNVSILGVQGNVEELKGTKIEITKNGTYTPEEPYNAFTEVEANMEPDLSEYFTDTITEGNDSSSGISRSIKKIPMFEIKGKYCNYMFGYCSSLTTIPLLDTSKVTSMYYMFTNCTNLETIPLLDTSNVTNMSNMFANCRKLSTIPLLNTSSVTNISYMFNTCVGLISIPQLDTSNVTNMSYMFTQASQLETVPKLNATLVQNVRYIFNYCIDLTTFGGLQNIGQAYLTTQPANYSNYQFSLSNCKNLTHDSLMNVINNLYDIASKGVKTQQLVLGSTNISKLSAEEIAIATNKGFSVS